MIRLFIGHDAREAIGCHVFAHSVIRRATQPLAITMLDARGMPQGTNAFTYSRFLVPWLCDFEGRAIFMDGADMLMLADIAELDALFDAAFAVQVVKHPTYTTKHPIKYRGTSMECPNLSYPRKNWASVMLFNCAHACWAGLTPQALEASAGVKRLQFNGIPDEAIGALPDEWNRIVDEGHPLDGAKVLHWTAGIPAFPRYAAAPGAMAWREAHDSMLEVA